jgi:N-acetylneuraminic acid mutarotase
MRKILVAVALFCGIFACGGADQGNLGLDSDASTAGDGGSTASDATVADAGACVPFDAADCAGKCGQLVGRCGRVITCVACPGNLTCGGGGPNLCGTGTCTPSCAGKACGASDGCASVCNQGCACGPSTCTGCCSGGACVSGNASDACGKGGNVCSPCGSAASCSAGACVPTSTAGRVLLFGGSDGTTVLGDTWLWDGTGWSQRAVAGPPARQYHAMAALGGKVVLFGGFDGTNRFSDTWEWDGASWTKRAVTGPESRRRMAMATLGSKIVLFGGSSLDGDGGVVDPTDTWQWDGSAWSVVSPAAPGGRVGHRMATLGAQTLLFGGDVVGFSTAPGETWTWNGTAWAGGATTAGPDARSDESLSPLGAKVVLFGGALASLLGGNAHASDTWEWDGTTWTQRSIAGPPGRNGHASATLGGKVVLFGGELAVADGGTTVANDTWEYDGTAWTQRAVSGPPARDTSAMAAY